MPEELVDLLVEGRVAETVAKAPKGYRAIENILCTVRTTKGVNDFTSAPDVRKSSCRHLPQSLDPQVDCLSGSCN